MTSNSNYASLLKMMFHILPYLFVFIQVCVQKKKQDTTCCFICALDCLDLSRMWIEHLLKMLLQSAEYPMMFQRGIIWPVSIIHSSTPWRMLFWPLHLGSEGLTMHVSQVPDQWSFEGWRWLEVRGGKGSLFRARHRPEKRGTGDGPKLLSESAASFEPHQGTFHPS